MIEKRKGAVWLLSTRLSLYLIICILKSKEIQIPLDFRGIMYYLIVSILQYIILKRRWSI